MSNDRVHATHCCARHGCKYGDPDCPVETGHIEAEYECEYCDWERDEAKHDPFIQELNKLGKEWQLKNLSLEAELHGQKFTVDQCGRQLEELMRRHRKWYED